MFVGRIDTLRTKLAFLNSVLILTQNSQFLNFIVQHNCSITTEFLNVNWLSDIKIINWILPGKIQISPLALSLRKVRLEGALQ